VERLKISQVVVVEGRYDKAKLSSLIDGVIVTTEGFRIYKDKKKLEYLARAAAQQGVIILTDSDGAGFRIRTRLTEAMRGGKSVQAYIPDVYGKEKRKPSPGKEGKVGVEGVEAHLILDALKKAVSQFGEQDGSPPYLTRTDLYEDGLLGGANSSELRRKLAKALGLPQRLSASALLDAVNRLVEEEEYRKALKSIQES
jgi:ribonuclease M5